MSISEQVENRADRARAEKSARRYNVLVELDYEQMAAAEGWRMAHGIPSQAEALGELVRIGLLGEIAKIYRLVSDNRQPKPKRQRAPQSKQKS